MVCFNCIVLHYSCYPFDAAILFYFILSFSSDAVEAANDDNGHEGGHSKKETERKVYSNCFVE